MKTIITYGTFDLFHEGHINILKRAKEMGDYLIVGVTTDNYDNSRGKLNVKQDLLQRIENVKNSGLADKIIIEEYEGQKINDILKYNVDTFVIGSDWEGKFDYLNEYCKVIYLERTKGISSTYLREKDNGILKIGVIGYGRIANRFIPESKYVSGINIEGVYGLNENSLKEFAKKHELNFFTTNFEEFLSKVDAVYIATPHLTHYEYAKKSLINKKHVLCEKPMVLSAKEAEELYNLALQNELVLLEAIKTAYCPAFTRLISLAKSGIIGNIKMVEASFTKLEKNKNLREFSSDKAGGSVNELSTYPLLGIIKLLGTDYKKLNFNSYFKNNVDLFTKIDIEYNHAIAIAKIGLGVKTEGDMIISGTKGYIYVPAPWWKTELFEVKFENMSKNKKYFYKFDQDGLRYEIAEFANLIHNKRKSTYKLTSKEIITIIKIIEEFNKNKEIYNTIN
jgi:choline-phosphate cytidylyltransferase